MIFLKLYRSASSAIMIAGEADYATSSDSVMMFQALKRDDFKQYINAQFPNANTIE